MAEIGFYRYKECFAAEIEFRGVWGRSSRKCQISKRKRGFALLNFEHHDDVLCNSNFTENNGEAVGYCYNMFPHGIRLVTGKSICHFHMVEFNIGNGYVNHVIFQRELKLVSSICLHRKGI